MLFTEDFLHYVWQYRLYDRAALQTVDGENIEVMAPGQHNTNAGPDFHNARIKIGETVWAGTVEIHIASADWYKHTHQTDEAYRNVILHVVYEDNQPVILPNGQKLPTLILKGRIAADLYGRYHQLIYGQQRVIPCEGSISRVSQLSMQNWLTRTLIERLERKSETVIRTLHQNRGNWEETFYQLLAANFGFNINALPFELLARSLPQIILAKHKNSALQIEALIFGQAGMLEGEFADAYPQQLQKEFSYLKHKHSLAPLEKHLWKFLRLRPQNFPTIRLAQFAALINQSQHLFSLIIDLEEPAALRKLFSPLKVNDYWITHYRFDAASTSADKTIGAASIDNILLNTVVRVLFAYGRHRQQQKFVDRSLQLLEQLPAEHNSIIEGFSSLGIKPKNAFETQALLELKSSYCNFKKCLQCGVGNYILNRN
ncbi:DUF2851 family protein [Mucilaginibacter koreensis]